MNYLTVAAALIVFILCEFFLTMGGIDTLLWRFKTPPELAIQQAILKKHEARCTTYRVE